MNDGLIDAFRHNTWASLEILRICRNLPEADLEFTAPGTYGSIHATLWHLVSSEASYCVRLTGEEPDWDRWSETLPDPDEMEEYVADLATRWERFLAKPFDAEKTTVMRFDDGQEVNIPAGVVIAQVLHHGTDHRSQINTALTMMETSPPELGAWDYAETTGRFIPRS